MISKNLLNYMSYKMNTNLSGFETNLKNEMIERTGIAIYNEIRLKHIVLRETIPTIGGRVIIQYLIYSLNYLIDGKVCLKPNITGIADQITVDCLHFKFLTIGTNHCSSRVKSV